MYSSNKTGVACEMEPAFLSLPSTPNNGSQIYPRESVPTSSRRANYLVSKPFDLLQRTLDLQSDDIHHNEDSRLKFYPTAQDEKADSRFAQQMLVQYQRVATTTGERRSIVNTAITLGW